MHRRPGVSGAMSRCSSLNSHCLGGQLEPNLHKSNKISPNRWTRPHRAWWIRTVGKRPALQYQEEGASRMCAQQGDEDSAGKRSAGRNSTLLLWRGGGTSWTAHTKMSSQEKNDTRPIKSLLCTFSRTGGRTESSLPRSVPGGRAVER